jgi:uroporphyrin-3 C-methyltransferase
MDRKQLNQDIDDLADDPVDRLLQEKKPGSSGKPIAVLALLVALASVTATGWQWWQTRQANPEETGLGEALDRLQGSQQQLGQSVAAIETQLKSADTPVDTAEIERQAGQLKIMQSQVTGLQGQSGEDQASMGAMQGSVRSLEQRLSATESGLISVAASSQNSSVELNVAEIDFLLRTASERLSLFSDPSAADLALLAADVQLEALNDPMFLSVRQRIATARQALATLPSIDRVQLTAQLSDMQSRIPGLSFRGEEEVQAPVESPAEEGWWESFKQTMSSLVTVRRRAPEDKSLLSLEDKDYLRQGLWLQLESARLSLMRNDAEGWNRSLQRVEDTLNQFFKTGASNVESFLHDTNGLKQVSIAPQMPDISAPWTQLRQLRDSRRLLQSAPAVEERPAKAEPESEPEPKLEPEPVETEPAEGSSPEGEDAGQ